jgi:hypothetical protein
MSQRAHAADRSEEQELADIVERVIDLCRKLTDVSPAWVATQAMTLIAFPRDLHRLGYAGCHLELRQIARGKLRGRFDPTVIADADAEPDLFPETLQERYPLPRSKPGDEPRYRLLNNLTDEDVEYNVARMKKAGDALLKHADRLAAWHKARKGAA